MAKTPVASSLLKRHNRLAGQAARFLYRRSRWIGAPTPRWTWYSDGL